MTHAWTGRTAYALVERARAAGWKDGAILDALAVSESTVRMWAARPKTYPRMVTRARLLDVANRLDRAERRKGDKS